MAFVSATSHICERVLLERDNIPTLVRLVDVFYVPEDGPQMQDGARLPIGLTLYAQITVTPDDNEEHKATIRITRPDGSEKTVELPSQQFEAGAVVKDAD